MADRTLMVARLAAGVFLTFTAAGCQTMTQPTRDDLISMDDQDCRSMGLKFGTPSYADCRLRVAQMRQERMAAGAEFLMNRGTTQAPSLPAPTYTTVTRPVACNSMVAGNLISTNCN